ncbi:MacB-like periplasmic core domain protein [Roseivivax sp. THAF40]|uniref:ABC transporter permease n=1 Tax=unclassified Roseivivax TaxID=2639302 RepID=UPI001268C2F2|nr:MULTISPECIES: ABC transporter permease [unclassified Roseivivax]QFS81723.1 MacB-like periplasmic core domain protein [Roseivivax sp. THAF197b]QFT45523.1 MacB-like periplasmic core domain protein [Roseivivax sp. THAF40]
MNALFLATRYLRFHWARSLVLVIVAALILAVPLVTQTILARSQDALTDRAEATPMLIGNRGSQLDLAMNALYFSDDRAEPVTMQATEEVWASDLALPIPLHTAFQSNGARIVGTSLDYFDFRDLTVAEGRNFAVLGEAVLGAAVAGRLGLGAGDTIVSSPENLFDLDGVYPLQMDVVGILEATGSPDDDAVFVDVKTAWVIAGIGHGHEDVITQADADAGNVAANAALVEFNRITEDNIDSFHFHGAPETYPISAVIAVPYDARSGTILRGRYLDASLPLQAVVPAEVIGDLVDRIFRIKSLLDAVAAIIGIAALAAIALSLFLSWRMRAPELATAFRLGAGRGVIARMAIAEITILLVAAICLAAMIVVLIQSRSEALTGWLLSLGT